MVTASVSPSQAMAVGSFRCGAEQVSRPHRTSRARPRTRRQGAMAGLASVPARGGTTRRTRRRSVRNWRLAVAATRVRLRKQTTVGGRGNGPPKPVKAPACATGASVADGARLLRRCGTSDHPSVEARCPAALPPWHPAEVRARPRRVSSCNRSAATSAGPRNCGMPACQAATFPASTAFTTD